MYVYVGNFKKNITSLAGLGWNKGRIHLLDFGVKLCDAPI